MKESEERDFSKALIYAIYDSTGEYNGVYVGSTALTLERRINIHVKSLQSYQKGLKGYRRLRAYDVMLNAKNWQAKVLEHYPCKNVKQLHLRETHWILNTPNTVNHHVPLHTTEGKKQARKLATGKYDEKHREEKRIRQNQKFGCHCGGSYTMANRRQHWRCKKHQNFIDALKNFFV